MDLGKTVFKGAHTTTRTILKFALMLLRSQLTKNYAQGKGQRSGLGEAEGPLRVM